MAKRANKYTFIYPPTLPYDKLYQRPQQICRALADLGHTVYFCDHPQTDENGPVTVVKRDKLHIVKGGWLTLVNGGAGESLGPHIFLASWAKYNSNNYPKPHNRRATVYDCLDNFPEWDAMERQMFADADIVLCSSTANMERAKKHSTAQCVMVYNAADPKQFSARAEPAALSNLPKGIRAVFIGCVGRWVDLEVIRTSAATRPDIQFIFVGEVWDPAARKFFQSTPPNVHLLGHVPHSDLSGILHNCDVGIVPFITNDQVTNAADPIKVWEYLAAELPVVSTGLKEVEKFGHLVRVKDEPLYFSAAISQEFTNNSAEKREARKAFLDKNTWADRAKTIISAIDNYMKAR